MIDSSFLVFLLLEAWVRLKNASYRRVSSADLVHEKHVRTCHLECVSLCPIDRNSRQISSEILRLVFFRAVPFGIVWRGGREANKFDPSPKHG